MQTEPVKKPAQRCTPPWRVEATDAWLALRHAGCQEQFHEEARTVVSVTERQEHADEDRVSLAPLDPETALRALLAVDPDSESVDSEGDEEPNSKEGQRS